MARRNKPKSQESSKPVSTHGCLGKIGYPTMAEALGAQRRVMQRRADGQPLRAYFCPRCHQHHLGRSRRDGRKELRRTPDHHAGSYKERQRKYRELTEGK